MKKIRRHATKTSARVATAGWIIMAPIGVDVLRWIPFGLARPKAGGPLRLYNAIGAAMPRAKRAVTLFQTYEAAAAAIDRTLKLAKLEAIKRGVARTEWPARYARSRWRILAVGLAQPVPLLLNCPKCHLQHVDVDDETGAWATARHHRKHLCKPEDGGCGHVWAPANVHTVGVRELPGVSA